LTYGELSRDLTNIRKHNNWLGEGSQVVQQQGVRKWASAYWAGVKTKKGLPKFKSAKRDNPSLEYTKNGFRIKNGRLFLAGKIEIPVVWSRELPSNPASCVVFRDRVGDWFVSFVVRVEETQLPVNSKGIGIDWGVKTTATTDTGFDLPASKRTRDTAKLLKLLNRRLSKSERGSKKRDQKRKRVAKLQRSLGRQRKDSINKWVNGVVQRYHYIAIEDFKPTFLTKSTMSKQASDNSIGLAKHTLISKAERAGRVVALVDPAYSTMTCSGCGARAKQRLPLAQRSFSCPECGLTTDRDRNAARVILVRAGFNPVVVDDVRHSLTLGLVSAV
jgi:putative transposase